MARATPLDEALITRIAARIRAGSPGETATECEGYSRRVYYKWTRLGESDRDAGTASIYAQFVQVTTRAKAECMHSVAVNLLQKLADEPKSALEFLRRREQKLWDPPRQDPMSLALEKAAEEDASNDDIETAKTLLKAKLAMLEERVPEARDLKG